MPRPARMNSETPITTPMAVPASPCSTISGNATIGSTVAGAASTKAMRARLARRKAESSPSGTLASGSSGTAPAEVVHAFFASSHFRRPQCRHARANGQPPTGVVKNGFWQRGQGQNECHSENATAIGTIANMTVGITQSGQLTNGFNATASNTHANQLTHPKKKMIRIVRYRRHLSLGCRFNGRTGAERREFLLVDDRGLRTAKLHETRDLRRTWIESAIWHNLLVSCGPPVPPCFAKSGGASWMLKSRTASHYCIRHCIRRLRFPARGWCYDGPCSPLS